MTEMMPPPPPSGPMPPAPMTAKEAKGQAKAAKAYAKAQRPFWKKKRVILPTLLVLLIVVIFAANAGGGSKSPTATVATTSSGAGVSNGFGARDASADVVVVKLGDLDVLGDRTPELKITNNSSKRSNYFIDLSLESPDGKTQYDTTNASAPNVEPGQSTGGSVIPFLKAKTAPADAVVKVKSVSRTAA